MWFCAYLRKFPVFLSRDIIPIAGFEKAVALDTLQSPTYRPDAIKSIILNALVMAGPTWLLNVGVDFSPTG
jgi:hypothetical protein